MGGGTTDVYSQFLISAVNGPAVGEMWSKPVAADRAAVADLRNRMAFGADMSYQQQSRQSTQQSVQQQMRQPTGIAGSESFEYDQGVLRQPSSGYPSRFETPALKSYPVSASPKSVSDVHEPLYDYEAKNAAAAATRYSTTSFQQQQQVTEQQQLYQQQQQQKQLEQLPMQRQQLSRQTPEVFPSTSAPNPYPTYTRCASDTSPPGAAPSSLNRPTPVAEQIYLARTGPNSSPFNPHTLGDAAFSPRPVRPSGPSRSVAFNLRSNQPASALSSNGTTASVGQHTFDGDGGVWTFFSDGEAPYQAPASVTVSSAYRNIGPEIHSSFGSGTTSGSLVNIHSVQSQPSSPSIIESDNSWTIISRDEANPPSPSPYADFLEIDPVNHTTRSVTAISSVGTSNTSLQRIGRLGERNGQAEGVAARWQSATHLDPMDFVAEQQRELDKAAQRRQNDLATDRYGQFEGGAAKWQSATRLDPMDPNAEQQREFEAAQRKQNDLATDRAIALALQNELNTAPGEKFVGRHDPKRQIERSPPPTRLPLFRNPFGSKPRSVDDLSMPRERQRGTGAVDDRPQEQSRGLFSNGNRSPVKGSAYPVPASKDTWQPVVRPPKMKSPPPSMHNSPPHNPRPVTPPPPHVPVEAGSVQYVVKSQDSCPPRQVSDNSFPGAAGMASATSDRELAELVNVAQQLGVGTDSIFGDNMEEVVRSRLGRLESFAHEMRVNSGPLPEPGEEQNHHGLLSERLYTYGLRERLMAGDGNCQFRALSDQLYKTAEQHLAVRKTVVTQLKENPELYEAHVPEKYSDYIKKMAKSGEWGDHVTLQAAADVFCAKIHLLTSYTDKFAVEIVARNGKPLRDLWLSFWAEVHYNSIYAVEDFPGNEEVKQKGTRVWNIFTSEGRDGGRVPIY
eukprot:TRINITY_DN1159_c0_g2_i1.p1 TRINITY_DN1159_c0_g2~~TRINITY_DN1159_c0_g2_i1.p1  ORF type:complete len:902 (-),score=143.46 TRINITY_DN1159_c0_g2_i1:483-3188(-)